MANRVRSNSYDSSFLHRDPSQPIIQSTPRAAEAPPRYGRGHAYVPPATSHSWIPKSYPEDGAGVSVPRRKFPTSSPAIEKPFDERSNLTSHYDEPSRIHTKAQERSFLPSYRDGFESTLESNPARDKPKPQPRRRKLSAPQPSLEASSPYTQRQVLKNHSHMPGPLRRDFLHKFTMPPPRISPPSPQISLRSNDMSNTTEEETSVTSYEELGRGTDDSALILNKSAQTDEEDDSLFDFPPDQRRRRLEQHRQQQMMTDDEDEDDDDDDDSLDQPYGYSKGKSLQAAWKQPKANPAVSFGKDPPIKYYTPAKDNSTVEESFVEDSTAMGDRSLNSWYTKSAESEVEDFLRDIFLIGDATQPGRRRVKNSPQVQARLRELQEQQKNKEQQHKDDTFDEDEDSQDGTPLAAPVPEDGKEEEEDDPLSSVWNFFFGEDDEEKQKCRAPKEQMVANLGCTPEEKDDGGLANVFSILLGEPVPPQRKERKPRPQLKEPEPDPSTKAVIPDVEWDPSPLGSAPSLDEDPRLVDLATEAARSLHRIHGHDFDEESYDIDFPNDIKFVVIDLELPLGLIFQENDHGCWVTQVLPSGTASISGKVEVGDQLAAIDGVSAIRMEVQEIADIIKAKQSAVELTFMRYVGPLHPTLGSVHEEGYEVRAETRERTPVRKKVPSLIVPEQRPKPTIQTQPPVKSTQNMIPRQAPAEVKKPEKRRFRLFGRKTK